MSNWPSLSTCRAVLLVLGLLARTSFAHGQAAAPLRKIYELEKPDGSVLIIAENHHSMPFTTLLCAELVKMRSSVPLPLRINILPGDKPYILAVFTPEAPSGYSYQYTSKSQDGIYTGHLPDTSYVYRLPYRGVADTILPKKALTKGPPRGNGLNLYRVRLPANTPICAARAGTVIAVKHTRTTNDNLVYVQHEDGSYACYENIRQHSVIGQAGRLVAAGDTLAYAGGSQRNELFWFAVQYATDSVSTTVPVIFQASNRRIRPR